MINVPPFGVLSSKEEYFLENEIGSSALSVGGNIEDIIEKLFYMDLVISDSEVSAVVGEYKKTAKGRAYILARDNMSIRPGTVEMLSEKEMTYINERWESLFIQALGEVERLEYMYARFSEHEDVLSNLTKLD